MDDFEKELQAVIDRANADQYCDYYNAEYVGWHIKMLEKYRAFKAKQEALRFEVMSTGLKAAQESNPTEHIHICGDPSSPCDCDCMDRAA